MWLHLAALALLFSYIWLLSPYAALAVGLIAAAAIVWSAYHVWVQTPRLRELIGHSRLEILSHGKDAKFEIIAVQGLSSKPDSTWRSKSVGENEEADLLKHLLPKRLVDARITRFVYNSQWEFDGSVASSQEFGHDLFRQLQTHYENNPLLPIIFIGHSFGGIVIKHALIRACKHDIWQATRGLIFLGTPHQGSLSSRPAIALAWLNSMFGSRMELTTALGAHEEALSDLAEKFQQQLDDDKSQRVRIVAIREMKPSYLGPFCLGLIVDRDSAFRHAHDPVRWECHHTELNKFPEVADYRFEELVGHIEKLVPSRYLKVASEILNNGCYKAQNIDICRLSGQSLNMESCYINLELIQLSSENEGNDQFSKQKRLPESSIGHGRLKVPDKEKTLELSTLFDPRKEKVNATITPRRILIRGRAGVGKSTLCKKIIYEFMRANLWGENFDLILWIPLRHIRRLKPGNQNMEGLLEQEFFRSKGGKEFATGLLQQLQYENFNRTLFLLDGLDEVHHAMDKEDDRYELLQSLLSKPNFIITSRPYLLGQQSQIPIDMETEVMGFSLDQVNRYIQNSGCSDPSEIQDFLQRNERVQSLVRIPIQLDALCYTWSEARTKYRQRSPRTMTELYSTIEIKLWQKDLPRRGLLSVLDAQKMSDLQIRDISKHDREFLEILAFSGLCLGEVNFDKDFFDIVIGNFKISYPSRTITESIGSRLQALSFVRSSGTPDKLETADDSYHFLHLTFQEYFAAQYFRRQWLSQEPLVCLSFDDNGIVRKKYSNPQDLLHEKKYLPEFDVFWRFVCGLLQSTTDTSMEAQVDFFRTLESNIYQDLLGPTHQRLIIHCLAEVTQLDQLRTQLEDRLLQWLKIESSVRTTSRLISEREFPERALNLFLAQASEKVKTKMLQSLRWQEISPLRIRGIVTGLSEKVGNSPRLRLQTLGMLKSLYECLPQEAFETVMMCIDDRYKNIRDSAIRLLQSQEAWPEHIVKVAITRLKSPDSNIRKRTAQALPYKSKLHADILQSLTSWLEDGDEYEKRRALQLFQLQPELPEDVIQTIAAQFGNEDESIRLAMLEALPNRTRLAQGILEDMSTWLVEQSGYHRSQRNSKRQLSNDILQAVKLKLKNQDAKVRLKAMVVLRGEYMQDPLAELSDDISDVITTLIEHQERETRHMILGVLSDKDIIWPEGVLNAVFAQVRGQDQELRRTATRILQSQETLPGSIFQAILVWLEDEDEGIRHLALEVLTNKRTLPEGIFKAVIAQLKHHSKRIIKAAVGTLEMPGRHGELPEYILGAATAQLADEDTTVTDLALDIVQLFRYSQTIPAETLEAVAALLEGEDESIKTKALVTFRTLERRQVFPYSVSTAIAALLKVQDWPGRQAELLKKRDLLIWQVALFEDGDRSDERASLLKNLDRLDKQVALIEDRQRLKRLGAAIALQYQTSLLPEVWQAIVACFEDTDDDLRSLTVSLLRNKPTWSPQDFTAVIARLHDGCERVRKAAAGALVTQTELPDSILLAVTERLKNTDDIVERETIAVLDAQTSLSDAILEAVVESFPWYSHMVKKRALKIIRDHPAFVARHITRHITEVVRLAEDYDPVIRKLAIEMLGADTLLPPEALHAVTKRLGDYERSVRLMAIEVLGRQETLPESVLTSADLYPIWLELCFENHVYCCVEDGACYLHFPKGMGRVRIRGDPDAIREALLKRRSELETW